MSRKRLKIQDMRVSEISSSGEAYLSLTLQTNADHVQWLAKQMKKCVDLFDLDLKLANETVPVLQTEEEKHQEWKELYARICGCIF